MTNNPISTKRLVTMVFALGPAFGLLAGGVGAISGVAPAISLTRLAVAQEPLPPPPPPPATPPPPTPAQASEKVAETVIQPDTRPQKPLSLQEAIEGAVANNLSVAIRRKDPEFARWGVVQQQAVFDPLLGANASYGKSKSEPLSDFGAKGNKFWSGTVSLSQLLQEGFSYNASWTSSKSRVIYPPAAFQLPFFDPASPTYISGLNLQFNQPLLRGFGFSVNRTQIEIAQLGVSTSQEGFRATAIATLADAENAYWDLTAAISNLEVQSQSLKLAQDLLDLNKKKVEVGTLAPIQITEAEASVASREQGVILAQADIGNAEDNLRRIMNLPPDAPDWGMAIRPTDAAPFEPTSIDRDAMEKAALEMRPEIVEARNQVKVNDLQYRFAQNARKPQLDAFATYAPSGNNYEPGRVTLIDTNGDGTPDGSRVILHGWSESASEVFSNNVYDWSVGLRFSIPIGNRNAKAGEARSHIALEQSQMSLEDLERNVLVQVRTASRAVETFKKSVDSARSNVVLQRKKLEAEQKRYDNGMSTSFQVLTFQNDLTLALSQEIAAITAYNKSLVELGRVTATGPQRRGITITTQ